MADDLSTSNEKNSVHYVKDGDTAERWRKEFIRNKKYEADLEDIKKINYEEVDYAPLLESEPFPELVLNNYDHFYGQAEREVESKYFFPIAIRSALFLVLGIVLIVFFNMTLLAIVTVLSGLLAASLYYTQKKKNKELIEANIKVEEDIKIKHAEETKVYNEAKIEYEENEKDRIDSINRLLQGNENAISTRLIESFKTIHWPILVEADIMFRNNVPVVKVALPSKGIIPHQVCELLPSGRLQYKEKDNRTVNKQYFELCSAIVIQSLLIVLGNIPSFQYGYACGIAKGPNSDDCLISVRTDKQNAADAGRIGTALSALQLMDSLYETNTNFFLFPVEPEMPSEWGDNVEIHKITNVHVKIYK